MIERLKRRMGLQARPDKNNDGLDGSGDPSCDNYNCLLSAAAVASIRTGFNALTPATMRRPGDFTNLLIRCFCGTNMDHEPASYVA